MTWVAVALGVLFLLGGLRLRARAAALAVLAPSDQEVAPTHRFLWLAGVELDAASRRAASAYAVAEELEVLDLVPRSAPYVLFLGLLETVDPRLFRGRRLASGRTAGQAILVTEAALRRADAEDSPFLSGGSDDVAAFLGLATELKRCAPMATDLAVADITARPENPAQRRAILGALFGNLATGVMLVPLAVYALMALCLVTRPWWGLGVVAIHHLQPGLALLGVRALAPRGLGAAALLRFPTDLWIWTSTFFAPSKPRWSDDEIEARRAEYVELVRGGVEKFFEPPRETCWLCGSADLRVALRSGEAFQKKPGRFTLVRCAGCGLVFQNPRLSLAGLDYYYKDFYDGLGADNLEFVFSLGVESYHQRARSVEGLVDPAAWLDVGGGHGHFCLVAPEVWPQTRFDVLDMSESVEIAARRGWVGAGLRGQFGALAPDLEGRYDVVSMSHYLEHTTDPVGDVQAAARVLRPGGILMVEVPDPESRYGRWFGAGWMPWFQPQHLNLLTADNMQRVLSEAGFDAVRWDRHEAHQPCDWIFLVLVWAHRLSWRSNNPWLSKATVLQRAASILVWTVAAPLLLVAGLLDFGIRPLVRPLRLANTYRVAARKR